ncbi:hypothetical protein QR680_000076 [Steinernema hermaphroditum]|uniref:G-protein coupled receptors family 1 profile domain-containing protein n=1 Tax=Steinernema hermaphroditum TaxID=289476 RepID=A0AA39GT88_9BILA|nr:hypothetical protein QR680_000076 [Steinernema hermaphroditum]
MVPYETLNDTDVAEIPLLITFHTINFYFGIAGTLVNVLLLLIFLTYRLFVNKYKVLIILAVADSVNTIAVVLMGHNRVALYSEALEMLKVPMRTSWQCAIEPWMAVKLIGDLWPPIIHIIMGLERLLSIMTPVWYRKKMESRSLIVGTTTVGFVVISVAVGFAIAWIKDSEGYVEYYCGRKAAFSKPYGSYIYITNVFGYSLGFLLNFAAYGKAQMLRKSKNAMSHLRRIRYYLLISFCSTVLVSLPNIISLCSAWIKDVNNAVSKPAVWAMCFNSSLNLFVYIALNQDFRRRCLQLLKMRVKVTIKSPANAVHNAATMPTRVMRIWFLAFLSLVPSYYCQKRPLPPRARRAHSVVDYDTVPNDADESKRHFGAVVHPRAMSLPLVVVDLDTKHREDDSSEEIIFKVGRNIIPYSKFRKEFLRKLRRIQKFKEMDVKKIQMVDGNSEHEAVINSLSVSMSAAEKIKHASVTATTASTQTTEEEAIIIADLTLSTDEPDTATEPNVPVPIKIRRVRYRPVAERFRKRATQSDYAAVPQTPTTEPSPINAAVAPAPTNPQTEATAVHPPAIPQISPSGTAPANEPSALISEHAATEAVPHNIQESSIAATTPTTPVTTTPKDSSFAKGFEPTPPPTEEERRTRKPIRETIYNSIPERFQVGRNYVPKELYARQERLAKKKLLEMQKALEQMKVETQGYEIPPQRVADLPLHATPTVNVVADLKTKIIDVPKSADQFVDNNRLLRRTTKTTNELLFPNITPRVPSAITLPPLGTSELISSTAHKEIFTSLSSTEPSTPTESTIITITSHVPEQVQPVLNRKINFLNFTPEPRRLNRKELLNERAQFHRHSATGQLTQARFVESIRRVVAKLKRH